MNDKESILKKLLVLKPLLFNTYHVSSLELFGSYARGNQTDSSDIDILVDFSTTPDLLNFIKIEELLQKELGKKVDLVPKRKLRFELAPNILHEAIAI